jgi:hypothetical protein
MNDRIRTVLAVTGLAILGIAVRAHDWEKRGLDYDERTSMWFVELFDPQVQTDYATMRNPREPGRVSLNDLAMEDFRTFPAWSVFARSLHVPTEPMENIRRLRWISILFAGLTVPAAYLLGLRFGRRTAVLSAAFTLLHPTLQFHGYNIRFYALFIFASTAALAWYAWVVPMIPVWWERGRKSLAVPALVLSAAWVGILFTIHIGVIFPMCAMLLVAIRHLPRGQLSVLVALALAFSAIPLVNVAYFFYVRAFADEQGKDMMNSLGRLPGLGAVAFNMGFGYCLLAGLWLLRNHPRDQSPWRWGLALGGFGIVLAFVMKANLIRADYVLGFVPLVLLGAALEVEALANACSQPKRMWAAVAGMLLVLELPSFWSTAFIDGDRVDYPEAIRFIREDAGGKRVLVVAGSPHAMDYLDTAPGTKPDYIPYRDVPTTNLRAYDTVYYVFREVKGFRTDRFQGIEPLEGKLVRIIGKDRLDLRACRLSIFRDARNADAP